MKFVRASGVPSGELQEPTKAQRGGKVQSGEPHIASGTEPSVNGRNPGRVRAWDYQERARPVQNYINPCWRVLRKAGRAPDVQG